MKKKTLPKIAALALSAALCLSLLPTAALAEDDRPDDWFMEYYGKGWQTDEVSGMRFYVDEYCNIHWDLSSVPDPTDPGPTPTDPDGSYPSYAIESGTCGADITWTLNKETGLLELNGTGEMVDEYFLTYPLYTYVTDVSIGHGITRIGDLAFSGTQITSVTIPDSVTHIGKGAFRRTPLTSVTIPDSVTSIDEDAFYDTQLISVTIPDSVETIGKDAFQACPQLSHVTLPRGLTHIPAGLFAGCSSLTSIEIPDSVRTIGDEGYRPTVTGAFYYSGLTSVTVPEGVTRIESYTFANCLSLTSITLPDSLTKIGEPLFNGFDQPVTVYGYTGSPAEALVRTYDSVTFVSLGMSAHADPQLRSGFRVENGTLTQYVGEGGHVVIPDGVVYIGDNAFQGAWLTGVTIPNSVTEIRSYAFAKCTGLTRVTIPDSVTYIGENAFEQNVTLCAATGSHAQWYAENYGLTFEPTNGPKLTGDAPALDSASSWARDTLNEAYRAGLIPEGLRADYARPATRAEFCALATALYETVTGQELYGRTAFTDTSDINVGKMAALGVVTGTGDGRFDPDGKLTREQAATMLSRLADTLGGLRLNASQDPSAATASASAAPEPAGVMEAPDSTPAPTFSDNAAISSWALDAVGRMQASGIMGGGGNNAFAPQGEYTREQSILTMYRLYGLVR